MSWMMVVDNITAFKKKLGKLGY